jgi:NADPH:quinone reductase-like Zn-dependent oxidoreductase
MGAEVMKAVAYTHCHPVTHEDALEDMVLRDPAEPRGHDLLVEVRAVSVNPVDAKQRAGADPAGEPRILGFDAAGVIVGARASTRISSARARRSSMPASSTAPAATPSSSSWTSGSSAASRRTSASARQPPCR